ncbi:MAG: type 2 isopentenyl-diphosphate Delta-isomerase [Planctomycetota bacterium]
MKDPTESRKSDHFHICARSDVRFHEKTTLLEEVELLHESVPGFGPEGPDPSVDLFGKRLKAPLYVSAMSGGIPEADEMNRALADLARELGLGLGLGSQRPALEGGRPWPALRTGSDDSLLILGNIGLAQARRADGARLAELVSHVGADALCVHLNAAQEWFQPEGDRDLGEGLSTLARLAGALPVPLVVKETGCGISAATARRLREAGVLHLDVAGAGGTTWVGVELERRDAREPWAEPFREWGVPTAASVLAASSLGFETLLASGGIRSGLEAAKALALGADAAGFALPVLRAWHEKGADGVKDLFHQTVEGLKTAMALTGAENPAALKGRYVITGPKLPAWVEGMTREARGKEGHPRP